jgi:hypothetical protein
MSTASNNTSNLTTQLSNQVAANRERVSKLPEPQQATGTNMFEINQMDRNIVNMFGQELDRQEQKLTELIALRNEHIEAAKKLEIPINEIESDVKRASELIAKISLSMAQSAHEEAAIDRSKNFNLIPDANRMQVNTPQEMQADYLAYQIATQKIAEQTRQLQQQQEAEQQQ